MVAIGAVAALAPVPVLIMLALVAGSQGLNRAWWFLAGFSGSLLLAGAAALVVANSARDVLHPKTLGIIGVVIGIAFLLMAARLAVQFRGQTSSPDVIAMMLGGSSSRRVAALGVVASALNPKTLPIFLTGVAVIAADGLSPWSSSVAMALLVGTASLGVALPPLVLTLAPGPRATQATDRVRRAVEPHAVAMAVTLLALVGLTYLVVAVATLR